MAYIKDFENDNNKYTNKSSRINSKNPNFTPAISINGKNEINTFNSKRKSWADLIAYYRWFP